MYDSTLGRFLERDPARDRGGINLFHYALGNPTEYLDPSGLQVREWVWRKDDWRDGYHTMEFEIRVPYECKAGNLAWHGPARVTYNLINEPDQGTGGVAVIIGAGVTISTRVDAKVSATAIRCPAGMGGTKMEVEVRAEWVWRVAATVAIGIGPFTYGLGDGIGTESVERALTRRFTVDCCVRAQAQCPPASRPVGQSMSVVLAALAQPPSDYSGDRSST